MSSKKRTADEPTGEPTSSPSAASKKGPAAPAAEASEDNEMGEFEDPWEDEIEDDEEAGEVYVEESSSDEDDESEDEAEKGKTKGMEVDSGTSAAQPKKPKKTKSRKSVTFEEDEENPDLDAETYLPGKELGEDEVLVADMSTYVMLHPVQVEWPCLSFDILRDGLGATRTNFPATMYMVAGSQAERAKDNKIYVMKMSQMHRNKDDENDDEDMSDDEDLDEDPILEHRTIPHNGGINRIRRMIHPTSHIVSTWSETGRVNIYDINSHVAALDTPGLKPVDKMLGSVKGHATEGYAMDWSAVSHGKLLTGDSASKIFLTTVGQTGVSTDSTPYTGHSASVEDIQWSPSEATVFASASVDQSIRIWDTRTKKKSQLTVPNAHTSDINTISWNKSVDYLLASGSDDGTFSVWDMRTFLSSSGVPTPAASFTWHKEQITSVEWHPFEDSMIAVSGADDQVTLWDLAVERDPEEEKEVLGRTGQQALGGLDVPPQLMFIHQGQSHLKEIHWHPQIPGVLVSTAEDGFNVFKTINS